MIENALAILFCGVMAPLLIAFARTHQRARVVRLKWHTVQLHGSDKDWHLTLPAGSKTTLAIIRKHRRDMITNYAAGGLCMMVIVLLILDLPILVWLKIGMGVGMLLCGIWALPRIQVVVWQVPSLSDERSMEEELRVSH